MSTIKSFLMTAAITAAAALSLTAVAAAAAAAPNSTSSTDYERVIDHWYKEDSSGNIATYRNTYNKSKYANLVIDGIQGSITGEYGYTKNFKTIQVVAKGAKGTKADFNRGTAKTVSSKPDLSGPYNSSTYFCEILKGSEDAAEYLDGYYIKLQESK